MKDFYFDKQTLNDLEIFKDHRDPRPSVFSLFNHALTPGGSSKLKEIMMEPSSDLHLLKKRTELFDYLIKRNVQLELRSHQVEAVERYLELNVAILKSNFLDRWYKTLTEWYNPTNEYYLIETGIRRLIDVMTEIHQQVDFSNEQLPSLLMEETKAIRRMYPILKKALPKQRTRSQLAGKMDKICRRKYKEEMLCLTHEIHRLDAFIGIAKAATIHNFSFPRHIEKEAPSFNFSQLRHPLLPEAKPYDFMMCDDLNMCFLTGPNMAGKSTFLKAVGIAVYLSHLGFPVPALSMETTVFCGMSTTINLPDNLGLGYSHYFAEVNRVSEVTDLLHQHESMFVIFDELFRGTNVKDAHEASTAIISAFAKLKKSAFLISTHIVEVAEDLKNYSSISFRYFDLKWVDGSPQYNYQLRDGVSEERLGMYILKNAGVLDKLETF